jgi:hypothetical protein
VADASQVLMPVRNMRVQYSSLGDPRRHVEHNDRALSLLVVGITIELLLTIGVPHYVELECSTVRVEGTIRRCTSIPMVASAASCSQSRLSLIVRP